jgi:hypothetical protein
MHEICFLTAAVHRNPTTNKAVDGDIAKIVQSWLKYANGRRTKGDANEEEKENNAVAAENENVEEPKDAE